MPAIRMGPARTCPALPAVMGAMPIDKTVQYHCSRTASNVLGLRDLFCRDSSVVAQLQSSCPELEGAPPRRAARVAAKSGFVKTTRACSMADRNSLKARGSPGVTRSISGGGSRLVGTKTKFKQNSNQLP
eukprot:3435047-Pleurochrysis_carterae.AAC.2